ncbi:T9SS type A sorting domain-containing protein, partial [bacterium]|nr:T9SS type A sorting domain-containing protein [bacterium]
GMVTLEWDAPVITEGGPRTLNEVEPNDDTSQAQDLSGSFPVQVSGNAEVSDVGDLSITFTDGSSDDLEDLYLLTTETEGITISVTDLSADLDLWVINQAATNIVQCTVDGIFGDCVSGRAGTADEEIDDPNFPAGTYYIGVTIFDPAPLQNTSSYTLTVTNDEAGSGGPVLQSFNVYRSETVGAITNGEIVGNVPTGTSVKKASNNSDRFTFVDSNLPARTFFYQVTALYDLGESPPSNEASAIVTSINDATSELPTDYALNQNFPNPFNPTTVIRYAIPLLHGNEPVKLEVYNMLGQKIRTLVDEEKSAGFYAVDWDGKNDQGRPVSSGLYVYRIRAKSFIEVKKMLLMK